MNLGCVSHEFFKSLLTVVLVDQKNLFDGTLLKTHLVKLCQEVQELGCLKSKRSWVKMRCKNVMSLVLKIWSPGSPCSHSSGTSPEPLLPGLHHILTHTDDLLHPGNLGSVKVQQEYRGMRNIQLWSNAERHYLWIVYTSLENDLLWAPITCLL